MSQTLSIKRFRAIVPAVLALILAISLVPLTAFASTRYGNCEWEVGSDGVLTITPVSGTNGELLSTEDTPSPWAFPYASHSSIISLNIVEGVKANGSMAEMFQMCTALETADLTKMNTSLATNMGGLFGACGLLKSVNLSGLDTSNVTEMNGMFSECSNLTNVNFTGINTAKVESMHEMFHECVSLEELDLSSFNTKNASDLSGMFDGCTALKKVTVGANFSFKGSGDNGCTLPSGNWLSTKDNKVYTAAQIAADRNEVADTYVRDGAPDENAGQNAEVRGEIIYRLYNPNNGEHLYTASVNERDVLSSIGWSYEGVGWIAPYSGNNVYRLYNPNNGDHFFTTNQYESDVLSRIGWSYEGVCWYSDTFESVPLYRLFNPNATVGCHFWTANAYERSVLVRIGWQAEGIGWYGMTE